MNKRMIIYILGRMLGVEGAVLLIPSFVSLLYQEKSGFSFLSVSLSLGVVFLIFGRKRPKSTRIYGKESFAIVALAWLLWSAFGSLSFVVAVTYPVYFDSFCEALSGFTTTGSTILQEIESLPMGINFWRCLTHWIGGMGVLVFVLMITSLDDENSMPLMRAEMPGPESDKLVPKARNTATILYGMYFALTAVEVILLMLGGMNLYDALVHSFSTAGTGGFNNRNNSVAFYDSAYIDGVITVFMILFGVNFNLYFLLLIKDWKSVLKNEELRAYLGVIAASIAIITANILSIYENVFHAFRYAAFQVASIITTTGFYTADYELWPELSKTILLAIMFIGACAGSTGGGIKVCRFVILIKSIRHEIHKILHPNAVTVIKLNGKRVGQDTMRGINVYFAAYVLILAASVLIVSIDNFDFATSFSGVLTTINNVGPGISKVGPVENFHMFSPLSKIVFSFDMLVGRLEIIPFLLLLSPALWRKKF